jgi:hypothetical protein
MRRIAAAVSGLLTVDLAKGEKKGTWPAGKNTPSIRARAEAFERHHALVEENIDVIAWERGDRLSLRDYLKMAKFFAEDLRLGPAEEQPLRKPPVRKPPVRKPAAKNNGNGKASKPAANRAVKQAVMANAKPANGNGKAPAKPAVKRTVPAPPGATRSKPATVKVPA